ncbi:hypothetical protein TcasGA2_TC034466 [Tribolium castaneum]|uniref:Uncharacterized protein n=2 Tax=Tribolium castaneum TaxID=7070 RepID=A0A139WC06_TRICA|nr:hypothetical protein TcasGA2_TC034466 [Tribolium castaneum]
MEVVTVSLNALLGSTKPSLQNSFDVAKGTDFSKVTINLPSLPLSHASTGESSECSFPFTVPPTTPAAQFSFSHIINPIVYPFPKLDNIKFPYIREVGIKSCMEILSVYFSCQDYTQNTVQYWFLDVLTDCLWKLQDEYHFPQHYQKIIIEWILYVLDLIRDPQRNLSRNQFFQIFNEAVCAANERVQAGSELLPTPENLVNAVQEEGEEISFPSQSGQSSSILLTSSGESYVAIGIEENTEIFKLPKPVPKCYKYDFSVDNSLIDANVSKDFLCGCEDSVDFYQPNNNTPERFLSSSSFSSFYSIPYEDGLPSVKLDFLWRRSLLSSEQFSMPCSTQRNIFRTSISQRVVPPNTITEKWTNYLDEHNDYYIQDMERNIMINSCALFAIKQFVHDYFYENFQYTVIQLALINNFSSITQNINTQWNVPKVLKEELKKPKPKKEKKKKKKKEKKKRKLTKKTKSKKDKRKKQKSKKKAKKNAKQKKKKLTKEEKAELLRQKREQERLEEELRRAEENRRMLFPLKEATDDNFFHSIFEHWIKPKQKKKVEGKKGKKKK